MRFTILILFIFSSFQAFAQVKNISNPHLFQKHLNEYRQRKGLPKMMYDPALDGAAKLQASYNYFYKQGNKKGQLHANKLYPTVEDRLSHTGFRYSFYKAGEICQRIIKHTNRKTIEQLVRPAQNVEEYIIINYQQSPSHDVLMRSREYKRFGICTLYDGKFLYNTVVFMDGEPNKKKDVVKNLTAFR